MKNIELRPEVYPALAGICPKVTDEQELIRLAKKTLRMWNEGFQEIEMEVAVKMARFIFNQSRTNKLGDKDA